jgi:hypothetical protein
LRTATDMLVDVSLFTDDEDGHFTRSDVPGITGTTRLTKDGTEVGTSSGPCLGLFRVPSSAGTYTLDCEATRNVPWSKLGTHVLTSWTFSDPGAPAAGSVMPPLLAMRARGAVDLNDTAPAGRVFPLTLHAQRQPGLPAAAIPVIEVEASFDDGATWEPVRVVRPAFEDPVIALVRHPAAEAFVSLRIRAADSEGNSVSQTVIWAYRIATTS